MSSTLVPRSAAAAAASTSSPPHLPLLQHAAQPQQVRRTLRRRCVFGVSSDMAAGGAHLLPWQRSRVTIGAVARHTAPASVGPSGLRHPRAPAASPAGRGGLTQGSSPAPTPAIRWGRADAATLPEKAPTRKGGAGGGPGDEDPDDKPGWGFLDLSRMSYRWPVPWSAGTVVGGMAAWLVSFVAVGFLVVPVMYRVAGLNIFELEPSDKALFTFVCQVAETVVSLSLVRLLTVKALDEAPEEDRSTFFNYSLKGPFKAPTGWVTWAAIGVVLSPFVVGSVAALLTTVGYEESVGGRGTVDGVASMIQMDLASYLSLLSVTSVMAPVLEETVFRGFLLTSLTRWTPTWVAIPASSACFALAHLSVRDFPVLFALGCLLGTVYVRSRNLLAPIIVHGAWNGSVLTILFYLASTGIDIDEMVKSIDSF